MPVIRLLMTTNGNDGTAKATRCTTMGRITTGIRFVALLGLLTAGTVEAWPENRSGNSYARYFHDRVHQVQATLRHSASLPLMRDHD